MRAANYWEQFLSTGKINDYLAYRSTYKEDAKALEPPGRADGDGGVSKGAGTGQCYRDRIEGRADRGI